MSVLPFPSSRRTASAAEDDLMTCPCGSSWFELYDVDLSGEKTTGAVVVNREGRITGYSGIPHCLECGQPNLP